MTGLDVGDAENNKEMVPQHTESEWTSGERERESEVSRLHGTQSESNLGRISATDHGYRASSDANRTQAHVLASIILFLHEQKNFMDGGQT